MLSLLDPETLAALIAAAVAVIIALIAIIITFSLRKRMKEFEKAYVSLQTLLSEMPLEDLLRENLKEVAGMKQVVDSHSARLTQNENKLRSGVDRAELIRFNSFENMGADLSFTLALLNQDKTGVVLTGIHSVEECRIYAKRIENGQATVKLSPEEKQAIEKASNNNIIV